jgi:hypothetical protein
VLALVSLYNFPNASSLQTTLSSLMYINTVQSVTSNETPGSKYIKKLKLVMNISNERRPKTKAWKVEEEFGLGFAVRTKSRLEQQWKKSPVSQSG